MAMVGKRLQLAVARRIGAIPLAILLLLGGLTTPIVSANRFSELEENSTPITRCEELSHSHHRVNPQRLLRLEAGRITSAPTVLSLSPRALGSDQHPVLSALGGHRLPNGLLAPLTC